MKNIALAVGGTGGHIYPAAALAEYIKMNRAADARVEIFGVAGGPEEVIALKQGIGFRPVKVAKLPERKFSARMAKLPFEMAGAVLAARRELVKAKTAAVAGFGGYVSFPTVAAAKTLGVPVYLHEQNALMGKSNRALSGIAKAVFTSFEETERASGSNVTFAGNPCRYEGLDVADRSDARRQLGLDADKTTLLVFGGSQGAASINRAAVEFAAANAEREDLQILHIAGPKNHSALEKEYSGRTAGSRLNAVLLSYCDRMDLAYAAADMTVCRAGATTMTEVMCLGVAAVLVPYPYAAEGHQDVNARYLSSRGAAVAIKDSELAASFSARVTELLWDKDKLKAMRAAARECYRPGAAAKMAGVIIDGAARAGSGAIKTVA